MKTVNKILLMIASLIIGSLALVGFATLGLAVIGAAFASILAVSLVVAWKTRRSRDSIVNYQN